MEKKSRFFSTVGRISSNPIYCRMCLLLKASCEFFIVFFVDHKPWGYECLLWDDAVIGETKGILSSFVTGGCFYVPV